MSHGTIVLIDTDTSFESRFRRRLAEQSIAEQYALVRITPDTALDERELVESCVSDACNASSPNTILAFLVDIVILEKGELDTLGINIARALRQHFAVTPIFSITGKYMHEEDLDILTDATLEDVDGVLVKSYLDGKMFSARRLRLLLERPVASGGRCSQCRKPQQVGLTAEVDSYRTTGGRGRRTRDSGGLQCSQRGVEGAHPNHGAWVDSLLEANVTAFAER